MDVVSVELGERSYDVCIGEQLLGKLALYRDVTLGHKALIVTNHCVAKWYLAPVEKAVASAGFEVDVFTLPDGERHKTLATVESIWTYLLEQKHSRDTTLIALGGGVIGDMVGFAAALYQRGVNFIQVPTTLLAQVDSSVGGKTGVNHPLGKNMIGAFYQPQRVIIDTGVLATLPQREIGAGLAEIIKYGLIWDADFYRGLTAKLSSLRDFTPDIAGWAIKRSCEIKAAVVAQDEREGGMRAILNLGHTFGHALEAQLGFGTWLHGEAVALGMLMAIALSVDLGYLKFELFEDYRALIARLGLPTSYPLSVSPEALYQSMWLDKKVAASQLRLILLKQLGAAFISADASQAQIMSVLSRFRA
jgi:3-dehydroquinate synthase